MTKPKAKSDSDESYVDNSSSSSEESEQDDSDFEDEKPAAKRPAKRRASKVEMEPIDVVSEPTTTAEGDKDESGPVAISRRPSKRKKKVFDENAPDVLVPSYERKTANGGYAHTSRSKSRISKANTGNTPWNKGKNRSSADRAKIAAGVRARNRAILLQKLERLKITEEEWKQKKKEIKYIRERLRIAKKANKKHEAELEKKKLDAEIRKLEEEEEAANVEAANAEAAKARFAKAKSTKAKSTKAKPARAKAAKAVAADVSVSDNVDGSKADNEETKKSSPNKTTTQQNTVFVKDIVWNHHDFDDKGGKGYDQVCPEGGPGGLICCFSCCKLYSSYLSQTAKDIEIQKQHKTSNEIREIVDFLKESCETLESAAQRASKKIPPLPPKPPGPEPDDGVLII